MISLKEYSNIIAFSGAIGFFEGIYNAYKIIEKRKNIKLNKSLKKYEYLLNGIYNTGIYIIYSTSTAFKLIGIMILFPVSFPILLYRLKN